MVRERGQERGRGLVTQLQLVDQQHQRTLARDVLDVAEHLDLQPQPLLGGVALALGRHPRPRIRRPARMRQDPPHQQHVLACRRLGELRILGEELPHELTHDRVRLGRRRLAACSQHQGARELTEPPRLAEQPRLADARRRFDQHGASAAPRQRVDVGAQLVELGIASDQRAAEQPRARDLDLVIGGEPGDSRRGGR